MEAKLYKIITKMKAGWWKKYCWNGRGIDVKNIAEIEVWLMTKYLRD